MGNTSAAAAVHFLREVLAEKQAKNPHFSQRSLARQIGVSHTYLSLLFNGKKTLSLGVFLKWIKRLNLDEAQLKKASQIAHSEASSFMLLEMERFRALGTWYYVAILDLTLVKNFKSEIRWIAKKVGVTDLQTKEAVDVLSRIGLLDTSKNPWRKIEARIAISTERSEEAVRKYHREMIDKALSQLDLHSQSDFDRRDITGTTMTVNPKRLSLAKRHIKKFRHFLVDFLGAGECTDLYQLNVQLFPLTQMQEEAT